MWVPCMPRLSSPFQTRPKSSACVTVPQGLDYKQHDPHAAPAATPGPCNWAGHVPGPALHRGCGQHCESLDLSTDNSGSACPRGNRLATRLAAACPVGQVSRLIQPGSALPALGPASLLHVALSLLLRGKCLASLTGCQIQVCPSPPSCPAPDRLWPFYSPFLLFLYCMSI